MVPTSSDLSNGSEAENSPVPVTLSFIGHPFPKEIWWIPVNLWGTVTELAEKELNPCHYLIIISCAPDPRIKLGQLILSRYPLGESSEHSDTYSRASSHCPVLKARLIDHLDTIWMPP